MEELFAQKQTYPQFVKYVIPSIITMVFLSFYTTIDGFFVSRFVDSNALAAINIIIPITCVFFGLSVMLANGSGALVGIKMGEKDDEGANSLFSFITLVVLIIGIILTVLFLLFLEPILIILGSTEILLPYTMTYGFVTVIMIIPMMFKLYFEYYARVDGSPKISLLMSTVGLVLNVIFDYIFIVIFKLGILGAGIGTFASITISAAIGLIYFMSSKSNLKFVKPKVDIKNLIYSCYNGSSEMFTEFSTGITTFLFNQGILLFHGEDGVAAMSIITYMYYFFIAVYFGITVGISPMISFNFGAKNLDKIKESLRYSFVSLAISSVLIFLISLFGGKYIILGFTTDLNVYNIACYGIKLFSTCFLIIGVNIFMSGYFTAIGNGTISAIISILHTLIFVSIAIIILPKFIGVSGIWLSVPVAEFLTIFFSIFFYLKKGRSILKSKN